MSKKREDVVIAVIGVIVYSLFAVWLFRVYTVHRDTVDTVAPPVPAVVYAPSIGGVWWESGVAA